MPCPSHRISGEQGFNPLNNVQASIGGDEKRFVGFYATDGGPIPFTIVRVPGRRGNPPVTLHLKSPIPPGETQLVVRVERRRAPVNIGKDGKAQAGLGRFPRTPNAVYARAIGLPSGSVIVRSVPDTTVTVSEGVAPWYRGLAPQPTQRPNERHLYPRK